MYLETTCTYLGPSSFFLLEGHGWLRVRLRKYLRVKVRFRVRFRVRVRVNDRARSKIRTFFEFTQDFE